MKKIKKPSNHSNPSSWRKVDMERVKIDDSLSFFEYLIVPDDNHLEIWNFQDYYDLDIKGRYTQISEDSIVYIGRNNRDSLMISLKKQPSYKVVSNIFVLFLQYF